MVEPTVKPVAPAAIAAVDTGVDAALAAPVPVVVVDESLQPGRPRRPRQTKASVLAAIKAARVDLEVMVSQTVERRR